MPALNVSELLQMPSKEISRMFRILTIHEIVLSGFRRALLNLKRDGLETDEDGSFILEKSFKPKVSISLEKDGIIDTAVEEVQEQLNQEVQDYEVRVNWEFEQVGNNPKSYIWFVAEFVPIA